MEITATCGECGRLIAGNMKGDKVGFRSEPCEHFLKLWERLKLMAFIKVVGLKSKPGVESPQRS